MTKAQLRTAIKREARINASANLDSMIDDIIRDVLTDACNKERYYELLKEGVAIVLVASQQSYDLPADFMHLESVRFARGPISLPNIPGVWRAIVAQPSSVRQTYSGGFPRYFRLVGNKISFFPYGHLLAVDALSLDYYSNPMIIFADDDDPFPIPRLESMVKKEVISRVQRFHSALPEAQLTGTDAADSFRAAIAGES